MSNFCFISNADNQKIKDKAPKEYKKLIPAKTLSTVMNHALCPTDSLDLEFADFLEARTKILLDKANDLIK